MPKFRWATLMLLVAFQVKLNAAELVWDDVTYPDGALTSPTYSVGGVDIVVTTSGATSGLRSDTPKISDKNQGGFPVGEMSLEYTVNWPDTTESISITVQFSQAVSDVSFTLIDIDTGSGSGPDYSFVDEVTVTGTAPGNATVLPTQITGSPANSVNGNVITGTGNVPNTGSNSDQGNALVAFDGPITSFTLIYGSASNVIGGNPTEQSISLHNISFIPEAETYWCAAALVFCVLLMRWRKSQRNSL